MSVHSHPVLKGRHVLLALFGFFGVIMAANAALVYFAGKSWTGLTTEHSYTEGLNYNDTLAAAAAQKALGWSADMEVDAAARTLTVVIRDKAGGPLDDLAVSGSLIRPTSEGFDRRMDFAFLGDGRYSAGLDLPLKGQWTLALHAARQGGDTFRIEQRLWID